MTKRITRFMCFVDVEITDDEWDDKRVENDIARQLNFAVAEHQLWLESEGHNMPYKIEEIFSLTTGAFPT